MGNRFGWKRHGDENSVDAKARKAIAEAEKQETTAYGRIPEEERCVASEDMKNAPEHNEERLDTEQGIRIVGGSRETYCMILETYVTECSKKLERLMQITNRTGTEYCTVVHAFRGSSSTIGADYIADLSERLEEASRQADTEYLDTNTPVLYQKMTELFGVIRSYIGENS